jgi:hypothetical protein
VAHAVASPIESYHIAQAPSVKRDITPVRAPCRLVPAEDSTMLRGRLLGTQPIQLINASKADADICSYGRAVGQSWTACRASDTNLVRVEQVLQNARIAHRRGER